MFLEHHMRKKSSNFVKGKQAIFTEFSLIVQFRTRGEKDLKKNFDPHHQWLATLINRFIFTSIIPFNTTGLLLVHICRLLAFCLVFLLFTKNSWRSTSIFGARSHLDRSIRCNRQRQKTAGEVVVVCTTKLLIKNLFYVFRSYMRAIYENPLVFPLKCPMSQESHGTRTHDFHITGVCPFPMGMMRKSRFM